MSIPAVTNPPMPPLMEQQEIHPLENVYDERIDQNYYEASARKEEIVGQLARLFESSVRDAPLSRSLVNDLTARDPYFLVDTGLFLTLEENPEPRFKEFVKFIFTHASNASLTIGARENENAILANMFHALRDGDAEFLLSIIDDMKTHHPEVLRELGEKIFALNDMVRQEHPNLTLASLAEQKCEQCNNSGSYEDEEECEMITECRAIGCKKAAYKTIFCLVYDVSPDDYDFYIKIKQSLPSCKNQVEDFVRQYQDKWRQLSFQEKIQIVETSLINHTVPLLVQSVFGSLFNPKKSADQSVPQYRLPSEFVDFATKALEASTERQMVKNRLLPIYEEQLREKLLHDRQLPEILQSNAELILFLFRSCTSFAP